MNWEAIIAISEVIGLFLVLVSVFYLSIQIHQNTEAIKGSTIYSITKAQNDELHWSSDISDVLVKAIENPTDLDSVESWKMNTWLISAFSSRQSEYFQFKKGLLETQVWEASENIISNTLCMPWVRNWWVVFGRKTFTKEFTEMVDVLFDKDTGNIDWIAVIQGLKEIHE